MHHSASSCTSSAVRWDQGCLAGTQVTRQHQQVPRADERLRLAGENLVDLGPYIADARALQLPLIGGRTGAEVTGHDWEAILERLGWLHLDHTLGMSAHFTGSVVMVGSLALGAWLLLNGRGVAPMEA